MSHYLAIAAEYPHTVFGIYDTLDEAQQDIDARIAIPKAKRPVRDEDIARLQIEEWDGSSVTRYWFRWPRGKWIENRLDVHDTP